MRKNGDSNRHGFRKRKGHAVRHSRDGVVRQQKHREVRPREDDRIRQRRDHGFRNMEDHKGRHDGYNMVGHRKDHRVRYSQSSKLKSDKRLQAPPHDPGDPSFRSNFLLHLGKKH